MTSVGEKLVMNNTPLADITFKPKEKGTSPLSIQFKEGGTDDSNMAAEAVGDILGAVENAVIHVGTEATVTEGKKFIIPRSDLTLEVTNITIPKQPCNDCLTTADILATTGSKNETMSFALGGIEGKMYEVVKAFSYGFQINDITENSVTLVYYPEKPE